MTMLEMLGELLLKQVAPGASVLVVSPELDDVVGAAVAASGPEARTRIANAADPLVDLQTLDAGAIDVVVAVDVLRKPVGQEPGRVAAALHRVLRRLGCLILVEWVADEPLPPHLAGASEVPAACHEEALLAELETVGFHGLVIRHFGEAPTTVGDGIECRQVVVTGSTGKEGVCRDGRQAVMYRGPFKVVEDDDGHVIRRGRRFAVCKKTFELYRSSPYADMFIYLEPHEPVPDEEAPLWDPQRSARRAPAETKGRALPASPLGDGEPAVAFVGHAAWLSEDGEILKSARVTHRFRGYFESPEEALRVTRSVFADAHRHEVMAVPPEEALKLAERARGKSGGACTLPGNADETPCCSPKEDS